MSTSPKNIVCVAAIMLTALTSFAQKPGTPIFQDKFTTKDTFAERWVVHGKVHPAPNKIVNDGGSIQTRRETPGEFYTEVEFGVDGALKKDARAGFEIAGLKFDVPNTDLSFGKHIKAVLIRTLKDGTARYLFKVNGKKVEEKTAPLKADADGKYKPLKLVASGLSMSLYSYGLFAVKTADSSPNLVINSGFEHLLDGYPPYHTTPQANMKTMKGRPYEDVFESMRVDSDVKHSGKYSLRILQNGASSNQIIRPWGVGTVEGLSGVFSAWIKAEKEGATAILSFGRIKKNVKLTTEWARYEVVNPELPAPGIYTPVAISFKGDGAIWVDDLQAEFIEKPSENDMKSGKLFATKYKASDLDKSRFGKKVAKAAARAPEMNIPLLPQGVVPGIDLDAWKSDAQTANVFYINCTDRLSTYPTELYLACDKENLYVGVRVFQKVPASADLKKQQVEVLIDPTGSGKYLQYYQFCAFGDGSRSSSGLGLDKTWQGDWSSEVRCDEAKGTVDYLLRIPFHNLTSPELNNRCILNVHRYIDGAADIATLIKHNKPSFLSPQCWPFANLPGKVAKNYSLGASSAIHSNDTVSVEFENKSGADRNVVADVASMDGKSVAKKEIVLPAGDKKIVAFPVRLNVPKVVVKLSENGKALSNQIVKSKKSLPLSMLGRLSFYMREKEAPFRVTTTLPEPDRMTAVLSCGDVSVRAKAATKFTIALPLEKIPDGTHDVTLKLEKDGKTIAETKSTLIKRPYREGAAQVNHFARCLMHDGKPVFPYAPFDQLIVRWGDSDETVATRLDLLKRYGFHYSHLLTGKGRSAKDKKESIILTRKFLEEAWKNGVKVMLWTKYIDYTDEECAESRKMFDVPSVITQMVLDEPELSTPSDVSRDFLRKMRPLFPYQPTQMNNTILGIPNNYADLETDILMIDDYIANTEDRPVESVVRNVEKMWEAGVAEGKPCWIFIEGNCTPLHFREPTYNEQIAQVYGCITAGCTGFSMLYGWPGTESNWKAYLQLVNELRSLNDILCSEEECVPVQTTGNPKFMRSRTKKHKGALYVVSCNIDENPADKVIFTLPTEYQYTGDVEVLFENRSIPVRDGKFSDIFGGHERHVYKINLK